MTVSASRQVFLMRQELGDPEAGFSAGGSDTWKRQERGNGESGDHSVAVGRRVVATCRFGPINRWRL